MNSFEAFNRNVKSTDGKPLPKPGVVKPGDLRLRLELRNIHVHQNTSTTNHHINSKPNTGSSIFLPRPLNIDSNSKYLNAKKSGDTYYGNIQSYTPL
jgi:hypothetical protein